MRKTSFVPTMYLTLGLALTPAAAFANHGGFHGGRVAVGQVAGGPVVSRPFVTHPFVPHPFVAHPFLHHRFFRPFVPFGVITSPVVIYAPPPVAYSAPPVSYGPPLTVGNFAVPQAPAPMPTVVQYPHGRYELRGDGVTTAYTWVWVPNPPPPPPPPAAPPEPQSVPAPPPARSQIYSWTDAQGVTIWTNRAEKMPEGSRAQAKRLQSRRHLNREEGPRVLVNWRFAGGRYELLPDLVWQLRN